MRFDNFKRAELLRPDMKLISIIGPYRIYANAKDYEIRCNICGAICQNTFGHPTTDNHYYLACPLHGIRKTTAEKFLKYFLDLEDFFLDFSFEMWYSKKDERKNKDTNQIR